MQYKSLPEPVTLVEDEIELVGVSYSLGEHHTGQTDAYADIMPVVSPNYVVFAPNQFLMAIPDFVWLKILIPLMGLANYLEMPHFVDLVGEELRWNPRRHHRRRHHRRVALEEVRRPQMRRWQ